MQLHLALRGEDTDSFECHSADDILVFGCGGHDDEAVRDHDKSLLLSFNAAEIKV